MANDVQNLLDMLYTMVDEAKNAPLSSEKCVINRDEALDLLDEIRGQLPNELKRAQELIHARDEFVAAAKRDANRLMEQAEFDAKTKISDSEILMAARKKGHDIIAHAEERCREMYRTTNEYTEDALRRTEDAVQMALKEVQDSRSRFHAASQAQMQQKQEEMKKSSADFDKDSRESL